MFSLLIQRSLIRHLDILGRMCRKELLKDKVKNWTCNYYVRENAWKQLPKLGKFHYVARMEYIRIDRGRWDDQNDRTSTQSCCRSHGLHTELGMWDVTHKRTHTHPHSHTLARTPARRHMWPGNLIQTYQPYFECEDI